jgi:hypothetical protein
LEIVSIVAEYVDPLTLRKITDRFGVRANRLEISWPFWSVPWTSGILALPWTFRDAPTLVKGNPSQLLMDLLACMKGAEDMAVDSQLVGYVSLAGGKQGKREIVVPTY